MVKAGRDVEQDYPLPDFIAKLRRLADALESGERFEIMIAGERISVPVRARFNIEHERGDGGEEIEFQVKWKTELGGAVASDRRRKTSVASPNCRVAGIAPGLFVSLELRNSG